jgi:hypothetical protein
VCYPENAAEGKNAKITNISGRIKSFKWSKEGGFLAFVRTDQETKQERQKKKRKYDQIVVDHNYKFDHLI